MTRPPELSYFVCGVPRTGSTLFAALLAGTGVAGNPREHFAPEYEPEWALYDPAAFVAHCVARGCNSSPVFGAKILWDHRVHLLRRLRHAEGSAASLPDRALLERTFPNPRFLWIRREDVLAQAVSWAKALQTQEWGHGNPEAIGYELRFDFERIDRLVAEAEGQNDAWARWFAEQEIEPFTTSYEELVADMGGVTRRALDFIGVDYLDDVPITSWTRRQADGVSADWIVRYTARHTGRRRRRRRSWAPPRAVKTSYLLCQSVRSGGELLADLLGDSRLVGRPRLWEPSGPGRRLRAHDSTRYLTRCMKRDTRNGVFGMRVAWGNWDWFLANLRAIPGQESLRGLELLESVFPDLRLVWVRRDDVVAQAVSWSLAEQTGRWRAADAGTGAAPAFDQRDLDRRVRWIEHANDGWKLWFAANGVEPLAVSYEELTVDAVGAARHVLTALGVDVPDELRVDAAPPESASLATHWIDRYRELESAAAPRIRSMARYLHTMYRITDPERSRAFYEAVGFEFRRDLPIVRDGELEATNYFFGIPGQEEELELTFNHDGRTYELGTGYGHVALAVDDLDGTLARLADQGIEPERPPYRVREGGSRLCFVRDPDGYRIELIDRSGT